LFDLLPPNIHPLPAPSTGPASPCPNEPHIIAMTGSTNEPLARILSWIRYHQVIGFSVFYLFVEGMAADPAVVEVLRSLVGVKARSSRFSACTAECKCSCLEWACVFHTRCHSTVAVELSGAISGRTAGSCVRESCFTSFPKRWQPRLEDTTDLQWRAAKFGEGLQGKEVAG
jgi:hypothetical protein